MNRRAFLAALAAVFAWRKPAYRTFIAPRYFTAPPMLGLGSLFNPKEDLAALWAGRSGPRVGHTIRVKTLMSFVPYEIPAPWQAEELWTMTPRGMVSSTGSARPAAAAASASRSPALSA